MAERFFEDYEMEVDARASRVGRSLDEREIHDAKVETATTAMAKLMLPGMLGIVTDAAGLLVIYITTIQQMRNLASFGSFWVLAIIFNVILLHPIMIAYLPPPHDTKHYTPRFMNWILGRVGALTTGAVSKFGVIGAVSVFFVFATYYVLYHSTIGENRPGTPLLWPDHPFNVATQQIAKRFGGLDQFVIFVDGDQRGSSSDGFVLQKMEGFERHMKKYADPGAAISLVNFIRSYWLTNHYGDPKWGFIPDSPQTVGAIIFQLMQSGTPGALRPFITDEREDSNITFFFPDHRGRTITKAAHFAEQFIRANPMGKFSVRLIPDEGRVMNAIYYMIGPLLPPRHQTMHVYVTQFSEDQQEILGYTEQKLIDVRGWATPPDREEVEGNVIKTIVRTGRKKKSDVTLSAHLRDDLDIAPDTLGKIALKLSSDFDYRVETVVKPAKKVPEDWDTVGDIVDYVIERGTFFIESEWDGGETGAKAQTIRYCRTYCGYELWVKNAKFKDKSWNPQPTGSWTRGAEFVMAGGLMGILAAVNDEVERGHVANILLIFLVVFTFVSVSYRSATAGAVIVFSLANGTILSLFYMALRGTGLNINTLPVQSVGVGIGVDYAIYITDRIRQEYSWCGDLNEGIRRAIRTTGMAVTFTATTLVGGIIAWSFSNLRFQAEMAQLLSILMVVNMAGAILIVPSWFSILKPSFFAASLTKESEPQEVGAERQVAAGRL
jgi:acyl carrier protein